MARISGTFGPKSLAHISLLRLRDSRIISVWCHQGNLTSHVVSNYRNLVATGPNFPLANGALVPSIESVLKYAYGAVSKIQRQGIKSLHPKTTAVDEFQIHKDAMMEDLVWTSGCRSWLALPPSFICPAGSGERLHYNRGVHSFIRPILLTLRVGTKMAKLTEKSGVRGRVARFISGRFWMNRAGKTTRLTI